MEGDDLVMRSVFAAGESPSDGHDIHVRDEFGMVRVEALNGQSLINGRRVNWFEYPPGDIKILMDYWSGSEVTIEHLVMSESGPYPTENLLVVAGQSITMSEVYAGVRKDSSVSVKSANIDLEDTGAAGTLEILPRSGGYHLTTDYTVAGTFLILGWDQQHIIDITEAYFDLADIKLGAAPDRLTIDGLQGQDLRVWMGAGSDSIVAPAEHELGLQVGSASFDGADGTDVVYQNLPVVNVTNAWSWEVFKTLDGI